MTASSHFENATPSIQFACAFPKSDSERAADENCASTSNNLHNHAIYAKSPFPSPIFYPLYSTTLLFYLAPNACFSELFQSYVAFPAIRFPIGSHAF